MGYWIVPIGPPQHPKHPSLGPTSIPIPTPASDHGSLAEGFARLEVDAILSARDPVFKDSVLKILLFFEHTKIY